MYAVIWKDENEIRHWLKAEKLTNAIDLCLLQDDAEVFVSLNKYNEVLGKIKRLESKLDTIQNIVNKENFHNAAIYG